MKKILVIGSLNFDFVYQVHHLPQEGETILAKHMSSLPGGKGANQAFAAGKLGADVTLLGAVGQDASGEASIANQKAAGVNTDPILVQDGIATGHALIPVDEEGNNSIIVLPGANLTVTPQVVRDHEGLIEETDILVLQMEIPIESVLEAARLAKKHEKLVILDPAPVPNELPRYLFNYVDILKPNETELCRLLKNEEALENLEVATTKLRELGIPNIVVTLGKDGSFVHSSVHGTYQVPPMDVPKVDSTGAGDAFTAGLAVGLSRHLDLLEAVQFATKVSSYVITKPGAQAAMPTLEDLESWPS